MAVFLKSSIVLILTFYFMVPIEAIESRFGFGNSGLTFNTTSENSNLLTLAPIIIGLVVVGAVALFASLFTSSAGERLDYGTNYEHQSSIYELPSTVNARRFPTFSSAASRILGLIRSAGHAYE